MNRGYYEQLRREVKNWRDERLITADQCEAILARYPAPRSVNVASLIYLFAALLAGLGVILLVAANWAALPQLMRFALIQVLVVASYAAGYHVLVRRGNQPLGNGLLFLGTMCFGAGILLIGQMFHIIYYDARGFLYWSAATAAIALLTGSRFIFTAAAVQLSIYGIAAATRYHEFITFYPAFLLLLIPFMLRQPLVSVLATGLSGLTITTLVIVAASGAGPGAIILYGALLLALAHLIPWRVRSVNTVLTTFGTAAGFMGAVAAASGATVPGAAAYAAAVTAVLVLAVSRYWRKREQMTGLAPFLLFVPYFAFADVRGFPLDYISLIGLGIFSVAVMLTGARRGVLFHVNLGSCYLLLTILTTYVHLAREFLSAAVLFLSSGVVLFIIGWLIDRSRRRLISTQHGEARR